MVSVVKIIFMNTFLAVDIISGKASTEYK